MTQSERVYSAILMAINDVHLAWTENRSLMVGGNISRQHYHARLAGHCERAYNGLQAVLKELNPALRQPEPEPEPEKVECIERGWHTTSWQALYNWRYCPRCGASLPAPEVA